LVIDKVEILKTQQVSAFDRNDHSQPSSYSIYQCLYFELIYKGTQYYLEGGVWYEITKEFYDEIEDRYNELYKSRIDFDFLYDRRNIIRISGSEKKNKEYIFNGLLAEHLSQYGEAVMLDSKTIPYHRNQIEICDVLYCDKGAYFLIHNKYKYGSSALSHLFSQGNVSAESITDKEFRKKANTKIDEQVLKFVEEEKVDRDKYTIVYGIIGKTNKRGEITIPVFSKINLKLFSDNLLRLGFNIAVSFFIDTDIKPKKK
jgi:uncharacterized protein (TIGR04141 family)